MRSLGAFRPTVCGSQVRAAWTSSWKTVLPLCLNCNGPPAIRQVPFVLGSDREESCSLPRCKLCQEPPPVRARGHRFTRWFGSRPVRSQFCRDLAPHPPVFAHFPDSHFPARSDSRFPAARTPAILQFRGVNASVRVRWVALPSQPCHDSPHHRRPHQDCNRH